MIKERDLVPGKVLTSIDRRWTRDGEVETIVAWMVIGFQEQVKRRHSKSSAPRNGWHVLLLRFGQGDRSPLWDVVITPSEMMTNRWKRLF